MPLNLRGLVLFSLLIATQAHASSLTCHPSVAGDWTPSQAGLSKVTVAGVPEGMSLDIETTALTTDEAAQFKSRFPMFSEAWTPGHAYLLNLRMPIDPIYHGGCGATSDGLSRFSCSMTSETQTAQFALRDQTSRAVYPTRGLTGYDTFIGGPYSHYGIRGAIYDIGLVAGAQAPWQTFPPENATLDWMPRFGESECVLSN